METTTAQITMLRAAEGKVLTDGSVFASAVALPSPEAASRWREVDAPAEDQEPLPTTCTKYEFVNALKELGLYDTLYAAYAQSPELQFYWSTVQELDRDNGDFWRFATMLGADAAQLDALFARIAEAREGNA